MIKNSKSKQGFVVMKPKPSHTRRTNSEKSRPTSVNMNAFFLVFFNYNDVMYGESLIEDRTVNNKHYRKLMHPLHEVTRRKLPELWQNNWNVCIPITHQLRHRCLFVISDQKQYFNHASAIVFIGFGSKIEKTYEWMD